MDIWNNVLMDRKKERWIDRPYVAEAFSNFISNIHEHDIRS